MTRKDRFRYWLIRQLLKENEGRDIFYGLESRTNLLKHEALHNTNGMYENFMKDAKACDALMENLNAKNTETLNDILLNRPCQLIRKALKRNPVKQKSTWLTSLLPKKN